MAQESITNSSPKMKTNGATAPEATKRENRGRGIKPELERAVIKALRAGESGHKISKQFQISSSTVYAIAQRNEIQTDRVSKKKQGKPISQREAVEMERMFAASKTVEQIAKALGRHPSTIYNRRANSTQTSTQATPSVPVQKRTAPRSIAPKALTQAYEEAYRRVRAGGVLSRADHLWMLGYLDITEGT